MPIADQEIGWNLGGIYYYYPGAGRLNGAPSNYNYWEIPVGLTYAPLDMLEFGVTNYYSPDFFGGTGKANYINGKVTVTPPNPWVDFALFSGFGHQYIEHAKDYNDWTVGATVTVKKIDFTFQYTDTNLTQADLGGNKLRRRPLRLHCRLRLLKSAACRRRRARASPADAACALAMQVLSVRPDPITS